jgi:hypothetical protein
MSAPLKNRQITRESVERVAQQWTRRVSTGAAAAMLGVGQDKLRELLRAGLLTRHRYSPNPIAIDEVQHLIDTCALIDPTHRGRISARQAADQLGLDRSTACQRARTGRIPAARDQLGRWWFEPKHVDIYRAARAAQALDVEAAKRRSRPDARR